MAGAKFGSRKLMLVLAFLLINSHSISFFKLSASSDEKSNQITSKMAKSYSDDVVWLVDSTNGQCLGSHGDFSECGELTLWIWKTLTKGVSLQSVTSVEEDSRSVHSVEDECLGRRRSLLKGSELAMRRCSAEAFSPTIWEFDELSGMMSDNSGFLSKVVDPRCVSNSESILQSCKKGFTALKRVVFERNPVDMSKPAPIQQPLDASTTTEVSGFSDVGTWTCPVTGQVFPRNLDERLSLRTPVLPTAVGVAPGAVSFTRGGSTASSGRQVFMGSGVFSKVFMGMNFNVYSMAWYVEAEAARADPSLSAFKGHSLSELQSADEFFTALSAAGRGFDRTLMVKLAMTLKTKMLLDGFLSEITLQPQNKEAVRRASAAYSEPVCPEGLEIIFTWRVPHTSTASKRSSASAATGSVDHEYLEVRIGDMYFELHEAGLAEDFMRQFFTPHNPVSPSAKKAFVTYFPSLLKGPYTPNTREDSTKPPVTVSVPTPASVRSTYGGFFGLQGWKTAA